LDVDGDGLISVQEALDGLSKRDMALLTAGDLLEKNNGSIRYRPQWDSDGDGYMSIEGEFKPFLVRLIDYMEKGTYPGSKLVQSHARWPDTVDMIGDVDASILILQGEGDFSTPFMEALLLEQKLTEAGHPDHTLLSYPGLGHFFYPTDGWSLAVGPMQDYVLHDLEAWLKDQGRIVPLLEAGLRATQGRLEEFSVLSSGLQSESASQAAYIKDLEGRLAVQEAEHSSSKSLAYAAIVLAIAAVAMEFVRMRNLRFQGGTERQMARAGGDS
jgi:hypothetical protein